MDDSVLASLRSFDGVWSRVSGTGVDAQPRSMRELTDMAARLCEQYAALSRRCPRFAQKLSHMYREESALLRRLTAEGFLLSGEEYVPASACAVIHGQLSGLRGAYIASCALADALAEYAKGAGGALRSTLEHLSAAERGRAAELRELILRYMDAI